MEEVVVEEVMEVEEMDGGGGEGGGGGGGGGGDGDWGSMVDGEGVVLLRAPKYFARNANSRAGCALAHLLATWPSVLRTSYTG